MEDNKKQPCGATCTDAECVTCNQEERHRHCPSVGNELTAQLDDVLEKELFSFDTLSKIVQQLEFCDYKCEGGNLTSNAAFVALKQMAKKEKEKNA